MARSPVRSKGSDRTQPPQARLFIALWPDARTRASLAAQAHAWHWPVTARREPDERLHLTMHFIGAQPRERIDDLARGLARVPWTETDLVLDQAAVWPRGTAVLIPSQVPESVWTLHAALGQWLGSVSISPQVRSWQPHVTLARSAAAAQPAARGLPLRWRTTAPVLVESWRGYRVIA